MTYNPIVRVFGQLRAGLAEVTSVPRRAIRPRTELATLLPRERRRELWDVLRRNGVRLPRLRLTGQATCVGCLLVLAATALVVVASGHWLGCLAVIPAFALFVKLSSPWETEFPADLRTVGDLTLYITNCAEHRASGYRWTRNEIAFKVRLVLCEALNVSMDEIRLESRLRSDLGM